METNDAAKKPSALSNKVVIGAAAVVVAAVVGVGAFVATREPATPEVDTSTIGYADATVFLDEESLQAAYDEAARNAANSSVALRYKNNAFSDDGINFECYLANSPGNLYDAFFTIYADAEMTDQVFLSGLVRPGSGFEKIKLDRALDPGLNTVYVAVTLVDTEDDGTQVIKSQVIHTMDFNVSE